jgi:hypothetical protein
MLLLMPLGLCTSLLKVLLKVKNHLVSTTFSVRTSSGWDFPFSPYDRMMLKMTVAGRRDLWCNRETEPLWGPGMGLSLSEWREKESM